ncbi:diadenylate cyclase, partial [Candidatus Woesearchaeota archaeon]|nr:diadenylate cyclase [Candidatus Woesearchaeota archaeon]
MKQRPEKQDSSQNASQGEAKQDLDLLSLDLEHIQEDIAMFKNVQQLISNISFDALVLINPSGEFVLEDLNLDSSQDSVLPVLKVEVVKASSQHSFSMKKPKARNAEMLVKQVIIECIGKKLIDLNSNILVIANNITPYNFIVVHFTVDRVLYRIGRFKLAKGIDEEVLERVLEIAEEISKEGREGHPIGTWFVIGDYEKLQPFVKQLVLNPFHGYPREMVNIKNVEMKETVKEFAQLDGAFIIDKDGTIISAGAYIDVDTSNVKPFYGWGSKHLAAVAITQKVDCIAVVVSQSGGVVKVFKNG